MNKLYKVLTKDEWELSKSVGHVKTKLDEDDGFVHFSSPRQLSLTLHLYFQNQVNLVLLEVNESNIKNKLIYEKASKGKRLGKFPHLYGKLYIENISKSWDIERDAFYIPEKILLELENNT